MKFRKFGKTLFTGALSAGLVFAVSSCVQSYSTGYLYVTGTVTAQPNGHGIISGFRIDHNTGQLIAINTLPVSSGGANPVRAVLSQNQRFLYVLNRGVNAEGNGDCTSADPCQGANIAQFAVGGSGALTFQQTFYTQGVNPFRLILDPNGNHILVLDHDAPSSAACQLALGPSVTSCGDITVFQVDSTTGRLSLVENAQVTASGGTQLTYFPVPANPVDFMLASGYVLTLTANTPAASYPYTGGASVFPYAFTTASGQLTLSQNSSQPLGIAGGTAIVMGGTNIYVLDNEPISYTTASNTPATAPSQILPFTLGANGALQAQTGGVVPDDSGAGNPIYLLVESKNKFVYVANQGNLALGPNPNSDISGFFMISAPFNLTPTTPPTFGVGSGPQCLVEDPSDQYIYTANAYDSSVSGRILDPNAGVLDNLRVNSVFPLLGPATWCLIDGRNE